MQAHAFLISMNWVFDNLRNALTTWNEKYKEIWGILMESPKTFRDGAIWDIIERVYDAMSGIGLSLLVLFFLVGILRHYSSFADLRRPESVVRIFLKFGIAKVLVTYGLDILMAIFDIVRSILMKIGEITGVQQGVNFSLPDEIVDAVGKATFWESIPIFCITMMGSLCIWVLSILLILTVYGRFFRLYLYLAVSPIPLATLSGEGVSNIASSFLKSFSMVCLEGAVILLSCVIYSAFMTTSPSVNTSLDPVNVLWQYIGECAFNMLVLVGTVRASDRVIREMAG